MTGMVGGGDRHARHRHRAADHAADGKIGTLCGVLVDPETNLVSHLLLEEGHLWNQREVALPADAVFKVGDGVADVSWPKAQIKSLAPVDVTSDEPARAIHQRSDVSAVPAAGVVAEAMVALVLAEACLETFGGDSVAETARNHAAYLAGIPEGMRSW